MVPIGNLAAFAVAAFVLIVMPGPSVLFTVSRALSAGRREALLTAVGNAVGEFALVVVVAFGLAGIVQHSPLVFLIIKFVGAGYVIYLGLQSFRRRHSLADALTAQAHPRTVAAALGNGFVVGAANPKTLVFFAAVLPQFVDASAGHLTVQFLFLGLVFAVLAVLCDSTFAVGASAARDWFARSPRRLSAVGGTGGLAMVGLGIGLAVTGRHG